jgi:hypothetical protein
MVTAEVLLNIHIAATLHLSLTRYVNFIHLRCHVQAIILVFVFVVYLK